MSKELENLLACIPTKLTYFDPDEHFFTQLRAYKHIKWLALATEGNEEKIFRLFMFFVQNRTFHLLPDNLLQILPVLCTKLDARTVKFFKPVLEQIRGIYSEKAEEDYKKVELLAEKFEHSLDNLKQVDCDSEALLLKFNILLMEHLPPLLTLPTELFKLMLDRQASTLQKAFDLLSPGSQRQHFMTIFNVLDRLFQFTMSEDHVSTTGLETCLPNSVKNASVFYKTLRSSFEAKDWHVPIVEDGTPSVNAATSPKVAATPNLASHASHFKPATATAMTGMSSHKSMTKLAHLAGNSS